MFNLSKKYTENLKQKVRPEFHDAIDLVGIAVVLIPFYCCYLLLGYVFADITLESLLQQGFVKAGAFLLVCFLLALAEMARGYAKVHFGNPMLAAGLAGGAAGTLCYGYLMFLGDFQWHYLPAWIAVVSVVYVMLYWLARLTATLTEDDDHQK